jgi:hypothetical protein
MGEKEMTIAQALRRVKEIKGQVGKHVHNAQHCVTHKSKDKPAYTFGAEMEKAESLVGEMIDLQTRIGAANIKATVDFEGRSRSLLWCTKKLAEIKGSIALHEGFAVRAQEKTSEEDFEWVRKEDGQTAHLRVATEWTCHLPEAARAARVAMLQAKFAELNDLVETMNHRTAV